MEEQAIKIEQIVSSNQFGDINKQEKTSPDKYNIEYAMEHGRAVVYFIYDKKKIVKCYQDQTQPKVLKIIYKDSNMKQELRKELQEFYTQHCSHIINVLELMENLSSSYAMNTCQHIKLEDKESQNIEDAMSLDTLKDILIDINIKKVKLYDMQKEIDMHLLPNYTLQYVRSNGKDILYFCFGNRKELKCFLDLNQKDGISMKYMVDSPIYNHKILNEFYNQNSEKMKHFLETVQCTNFDLIPNTIFQDTNKKFYRNGNLIFTINNHNTIDPIKISVCNNYVCRINELR